MTAGDSGFRLAPEEARSEFEKLYSATYRKVLAYARRRTPNPMDADDLVASTFLVAWRRLEEVIAADSPLAWLYGVAYRTLANQRRTAARAARLGERARLELPASQPDLAPSLAEASEALDRVLSALSSLSQRDQEILRLSAFEGLTNPEIALVLGIRPALVRSRLFRARRRLQNSYEGIGGPSSVDREDD